MKCVVFQGSGGNEVIHVEERPNPVPVGREVVVATRYVGMNPADLAQRNGFYPPPDGITPDIPGLEVCGTVVACGPSVQRWQEGQRVFGLVGGGGMSTQVVADERHVCLVPSNLPDLEGAATPEAFITAHDALRQQARLQSGDTVLVHGAAGSVGSAAVQVSKAAGANVFGVVRSNSAAEVVASLGGFPILDEEYPGAFLNANSGRGADIIIELVGSPHFPANLEAVSDGGRIIIVGVAGGSRAEIPLLRVMKMRARIQGTVMRHRPPEEKATAVARFESEVVPWLEAGTVRPNIDAVLPLQRVEEAFDRVGARGYYGAVLVDLEDQES